MKFIHSPKTIIMRYFIGVVVLLMLLNPVLAQDKTETEVKYKQTIKHANRLFKEGKFIESIIYYKEAQAVNPDENLPKYRIEDIKTIYVNQELDKNFPVSEDANKREKKEIAYNRMMAEKDMRARLESKITEMNNPDFRAAVIHKIEQMKDDEMLKLYELEQEKNIQDSTARAERIAKAREEFEKHEKEILIESIQQAENSKANKQLSDNVIAEATEQVSPVDEIPVKEVMGIEENENNDNDLMIKEKSVETPVIELEIENNEKQVNTPTENSSERIPEQKVEKEEKTDRNTTVHKAEARLQKEKKLRELYPDPRTEIVINEPGKKITKVIMNDGENVRVYLKVEHSWGGVYYFIDYSPQPLVSISQGYFDRHTKISDQ